MLHDYRKEWTDNAEGQVATMTARNPNTGSQVTRYVYGSTTSESGVARSDLLRAVIYPDSDDVENPLGNGTDTVYDRVEYKYNRLARPAEIKAQAGQERYGPCRRPPCSPARPCAVPQRRHLAHPAGSSRARRPSPSANDAIS